MRLSCLLKSLLQSFHEDERLAGRKTFTVDCSRLISSILLFVNGLTVIVFFLFKFVFFIIFFHPKKI